MKKLTKKYLYREYIKNKKSMYIIATSVGCSTHCIHDRLIEYNIKIRSISECKQGKLHPNFGKKRPDQSKLLKNRYLKHPKAHPWYKTGIWTQKYYCKDCKKIEVEYGTKRCWGCYLKFNIGKNHTSYINGSSFEPYDAGFSRRLKEKIRKRDNYKCKLCGTNNKIHIKHFKSGLCIHHIDYNKKNCDLSNLVSLCNSCHSKTQWNKKHWQRHLKEKVALV